MRYIAQEYKFAARNQSFGGTLVSIRGERGTYGKGELSEHGSKCVIDFGVECIINVKTCESLLMRVSVEMPQVCDSSQALIYSPSTSSPSSNCSICAKLEEESRRPLQAT